jgi:hypothetical protein
MNVIYFGYYKSQNQKSKCSTTVWSTLMYVTILFAIIYAQAGLTSHNDSRCLSFCRHRASMINSVWI